MNAESALEGRVVQTHYGALKGVSVAGVSRFLGVPYASAPVGNRRFQAPQALEPWAATRDVTRPGPNSPQITRAFPGLDVASLVGDGWHVGDDYLTANIWTPSGAEKSPVLVFIHGGAFIAGCSDAAVHDGTQFARSGIVCVAINYRLGVEGFLPIPGVPTNLGLRDQIAALQWVRDTIGDFGGDPANVSVVGESAGAMSIANLMASPLAKGLFRCAIVQSGHGSMVRSIEVAHRLVERLAQHLDVIPSLDGFRRCTPAQCATAVDAVSAPGTKIDLREADGRDAAFGLSRFLPVYGDDVLPRQPLEALANGAGAEVDLLIGTNLEEMNLYLATSGVRDHIGASAAVELLLQSEPRASEILAAYGIADAARRPGDALTEAMSDLVFRLPARRFAAAHRGETHVYEFGWRSRAFDGKLGACHGMELPFVFNNLAACSGSTGILGQTPPQELADFIHGLWVGFVVDGRLPWAPYDEQSRFRMALESGSAGRDTVMLAASIV